MVRDAGSSTKSKSYSSEDFFEPLFDPLLFEPRLLFDPSFESSSFEPCALLEKYEFFEPPSLLLPPPSEELAFFLGATDSSSASLDRFAVFDPPFDLPSSLEPPSSFGSEAVLCFVEPLCAEAFPVFPLPPFCPVVLAFTVSLFSLGSFPFWS